MLHGAAAGRIESAALLPAAATALLEAHLVRAMEESVGGGGPPLRLLWLRLRKESC